ncbi:MAG: antibiotic biosynthesis monooxygenase [Flavobacteriales bacterium]|nr:antibiotic biosynthesis monooxygenase [Flavobacteriales bacterium]
MNTDKKWVVIFRSEKRKELPEYDEMATKITELVENQPGFIEMDYFSQEGGKTVTICYWENLESIQNWKKNTVHQEAIGLGKSKWYEYFKLEVAEIAYSYDFQG